MLKQLSQDFLAGIAVSKLDWKVNDAFYFHFVTHSYEDYGFEGKETFIIA